MENLVQNKVSSAGVGDRSALDPVNRGTVGGVWPKGGNMSGFVSTRLKVMNHKTIVFAVKARFWAGRESVSLVETNANWAGSSRMTD